MKANNFDRIAWIYDTLARLVFGNAIKKSQLHHLRQLKPNSNILILGGGTGWLLKELIGLQPTSRICYIEASEQMLGLSKKKTDNHHTIQFIHGTEEDIPREAKFDFIITNFYLDLFTNQSLDNVIPRVSVHASPACQWIVTDFVDRRIWWQVIMLKFMYKFFRIATNIQASALPDWNAKLQQYQWHKNTAASFYGGFIESCIYAQMPDK